MRKNGYILRSGARLALRSGLISAALLCLAAFSVPPLHAAEEAVLRIYDQKSGTLHVEFPAGVNSRLFFGWVHSLEKIPWNEYYHIDENYTLVLDTITFQAFGAGIPEDKGRVCRIRDGLIYMEEIGQLFPELVWLNSRTATRDIVLDGLYATAGDALPDHAVLRLVVEKREF